MKRQKNPFKGFVHNAIEQPARVLEWIIFYLITALLLHVGYAFGGSFEFGFGLVAAVPYVFALLAVFSLWALVVRSAIRVPRGPLLCLPFLVWVLFQSHFLAKGEWIAEGYASGLLMAWVVYAVITVALRRRVFLFAGMVSFAVKLIFLGAFSLGVVNWHALTPEFNAWFQSQSRTVVAPFGHPSAAAFAYLAGVPLALVIAGLPRFAGFVRMAAGSMAVLAIGLVGLGGTATGLLTLGVAALLVPVFLRPEWSVRFRFVAGGLALLLGFCALFYVGFYSVRMVVDRQLEEQSAWVETTRWSVALSNFADNLIVGSGLGTSRIEAQKSSVSPSGKDPWKARSTPLELLSETGIVGGVAVLIALLGTYGRLLRAWKSESFYPIDKEAAYRDSPGPGESRSRRSRSKSKKKRLTRSTTKKVLLGGIVASLSICLFYAFFESAWSSLLSWLLLAFLLGLGERFTEVKSSGKPVLSRTGLTRYLVAFSGCFAAFLVIRSWGNHYSTAEVTRAAVALQPYRDSPFLAFENPGGIAEARRLIGYSLDWMPDNGDALALKAETFLMEEFIASMTLEVAGQRALEFSREALLLYPDNGYFVYLETGAKALAGAPEEEVEAGFEKSLQLMADDERVLLAWATYRIRDLRRPESARSLVERVLLLNPDSEEAQDLLSRINL